MVKYFTGRAYDARFDLYLRLGGRQVSPGGEFLLCRQKEPKPVGGSDSPKPLNGAGSEKNLAQRGLFGS